MGFSQSHPSVYKKRIVTLGRLFRDGNGSGMSKLVAGADYKSFEGIIMIQGGIYPWLRMRLGRLVCFVIYLACAYWHVISSMTVIYIKADFRGRAHYFIQGVIDQRSVIFIQPVPEESVGYGKTNAIILYGGYLNRPDPGIEVLLANFFLNNIKALIPQYIQFVHTL